MSAGFSQNDINWPSKGPSKSIVGQDRPAIARVWHGMLLVAQANFKPGQSGPIQAFMWDPYQGANSGSAFLSPVPIQMGASTAAPALFYADLVLWLFYSNGADFVCAAAPQPALDPSNNQIQFTSFKLGTPTVVAAGTTATNPSVVLFDGRRLCVLDGQCTARLRANPLLRRCAVHARRKLGVRAIGHVADPKFAISPFRSRRSPYGKAASTAPSGATATTARRTRFRCSRWTPGATSLSVNSVPNQWNANGGVMQCNYAPALAADPKGTFLTIVFLPARKRPTLHDVPGQRNHAMEPSATHQRTEDLCHSVADHDREQLRLPRLPAGQQVGDQHRDIRLVAGAVCLSLCLVGVEIRRQSACTLAPAIA